MAPTKMKITECKPGDAAFKSIMVPAQEFKDFAHLPRPIRKTIMLKAFEDRRPRVITVSYTRVVTQDNLEDSFHYMECLADGTQTPPSEPIFSHDGVRTPFHPLMMTCKEAHEVIMSEYRRIHPGHMSEAVIFNPRFDIIHFSGMGIFDHFIKHIKGDAWASFGIENIAIEPCASHFMRSFQRRFPYESPSEIEKLTRVSHRNLPQQLVSSAKALRYLSPDLRKVIVVGKNDSFRTTFKVNFQSALSMAFEKNTDMQKAHPEFGPFKSWKVPGIFDKLDIYGLGPMKPVLMDTPAPSSTEYEHGRNELYSSYENRKAENGGFCGLSSYVWPGHIHPVVMTPANIKYAEARRAVLLPPQIQPVTPAVNKTPARPRNVVNSLMPPPPVPSSARSEDPASRNTLARAPATPIAVTPVQYSGSSSAASSAPSTPQPYSPLNVQRSTYKSPYASTNFSQQYVPSTPSPASTQTSFSSSESSSSNSSQVFSSQATSSPSTPITPSPQEKTVASGAFLFPTISANQIAHMGISNLIYGVESAPTTPGRKPPPKRRRKASTSVPDPSTPKRARTSQDESADTPTPTPKKRAGRRPSTKMGAASNMVVGANPFESSLGQQFLQQQAANQQIQPTPPQYGAPQFGGPQYGGPQFGASQSGTQYGSPPSVDPFVATPNVNASGAANNSIIARSHRGGYGAVPAPVQSMAPRPMVYDEDPDQQARELQQLAKVLKEMEDEGGFGRGNAQSGNQGPQQGHPVDNQYAVQPSQAFNQQGYPEAVVNDFNGSQQQQQQPFVPQQGYPEAVVNDFNGTQQPQQHPAPLQDNNAATHGPVVPYGQTSVVPHEGENDSEIQDMMTAMVNNTPSAKPADSTADDTWFDESTLNDGTFGERPIIPQEVTFESDEVDSPQDRMDGDADMENFFDFDKASTMEPMSDEEFDRLVNGGPDQ